MVLIECVRLSPGYQLVTVLNETYLTYKDLRQQAMLLPKRKAALLQATHGQRICWELLRAINKGVASKRDGEVVAALKRIKEYGLAKFTQEPDKGEEICDEIAAYVNQQVAIRATNDLIGHGADGRGGNANLAKEGKMTKDAYMFLARHKKMCLDLI